MSIAYEKLVKQDINLGHGTVDVTMPAGGTATGHKVGIHTFLDGALNIADFGAVGDGTTDDRAAIQAAVNALPSGGGSIFVPAGRFRCMSGITATVPIHWRGLGRDSSVLYASAGGYHLIASTASITAEDLTFERPNLAVSTQYSALRIDNVVGTNGFMLCRNLLITGFDIGIYVNGDAASFKINFARFEDCRVVCNTLALVGGVYGTIFVHNVQAFILNSCQLIQGGTDSSNNVYSYGCRQISVRGSYFTRGIGIKVFSTNRIIDSVEFTNNDVFESGVAAVEIVADVYSIRQVTIAHNYFRGALRLDSGTAEVYLAGTGASADFDNISLENNTFRDSGGRCFLLAQASGSTTRSLVCRGNTYYNFSTLSVGTNFAVESSGAGVLNAIFCDQEYVDGNNNGAAYYAATATIRMTGRIYEINCTATTQLSPLTVRVGGTTTMKKPAALLYSQAGPNGVGTDAAITEKVLLSYVIPANTLNENGAGFFVRGWGTTAANANAKTIRLRLGIINLTFNFVTTAPNGVAWSFWAEVQRTASSYYGYNAHMIVGDVGQNMQSDLQQSADWTLNQTIAIIGENGVASANDIVAHGLRVVLYP